jgi:hypothetical protein
VRDEECQDEQCLEFVTFGKKSARKKSMDSEAGDGAA